MLRNSRRHWGDPGKTYRTDTCTPKAAVVFAVVAAMLLSAACDNYSDLPNCKTDGNCLLKVGWSTITVSEMRKMIKDGANVNARSGGETPLIMAIKAGNLKVIAPLARAGADVNYGRPLHGAVRVGWTKLIVALLKAGADVNARNGFGETPLLVAAEKGNVEAIAVLLKAGADVNVWADYGATPLDMATARNHQDAVNVLKKAGGRSKVER